MDFIKKETKVGCRMKPKVYGILKKTITLGGYKYCVVQLDKKYCNTEEHEYLLIPGEKVYKSIKKDAFTE